MILNHLINASIISLFYPISIFCYSLLENPRPPKTYWKMCYIYTFISIILKCFSQKIFLGSFLNLGNKNETDPDNIYEQVKIFLEQYPIGIRLYDNYNEYFSNLLFDFLILIALFINKNILFINGLWKHNEEYYEDIKKALERVYKYKKDELIKEKKNLKKNLGITFILNKNTIIKKGPNNKKDKGKGYFQRLFPKLRNEKPGKDFYYVYTLALIFIIFYVLIFYTTMVKDKTNGDINISINQFSGMSIILFLFHFFILIMDRVIYLRQNIYKAKYKKISFDENGNIKIEETPDIYKKEKIDFNKEIKDCIFREEPFNKLLLVKYILHIFLTILSHLFIFFYIPMLGNYNIYNATYCIKNIYIEECNDFKKNIATIFFYILYLFYLIFSALQIKYGFYDLKRTSIFKDIKYKQGLFYQIYKMIPFYYPLKNVIDWALTPTTFGIFQWFKFESIYDTIFKTYRVKYGLKDKPIGQQIKSFVRTMCGGLISVILILLLIGPLIIFSPLNPTSEINNINSAMMKMYMSFIAENGLERNILIFENNWAKSIANMTNEVWDKYNYSTSYYTRTFPREQIQIISFYATPENSLSEFKINHILSSIDSLLNITDSQEESYKDRIIKCTLIIENDFRRPFPSETREVKKQSELLICDIKSNKDSEGCLGLGRLYNNSNATSQDNITDVEFNIEGFSPIIKFGASAKPIQVGLENKVISPLIFKTKGIDLFEIYFENTIKDNGIQYHVLNERISSGNFGYSLIGFYSAFILVIGTYVAKIFDYEPSSIVFSEMPHPEILLEICEGIKISRYSHDFKNEEYYFNYLVEILRSPESVKKLTQSTTKQFFERKELLE